MKPVVFLQPLSAILLVRKTLVPTESLSQSKKKKQKKKRRRTKLKKPRKQKKHRKRKQRSSQLLLIQTFKPKLTKSLKKKSRSS